MQPVNMGLVGCGASRKMYGPSMAILRSERVARVIAVADPSSENRDAAMDVFQAEATYANATELFGHQGLDAVLIVSPIYLHEEQVTAAAAAGLQILCAKPMARTVAEAQKMVDAASDARVFLGVALQRRLLPAMWTAGRMIRDGALGEVFHVDCLWTSWSMLPGGTWRDQAGCLGGIFQDHGSHTIDLCQQWLGAAESVTAHARNMARRAGGEREVEDHMTALIVHEGGATSYHEHSRDCHREVSEVYRVFGTTGTLEIEYSGGWAYLAEDCWSLRLYREGRRPEHLQPRRPDYSLMDTLPDSHYAFYRELAGFVASAQGRANELPDPTPNGAVGLNLVQTIGACFVSSARATSVPVEAGYEFDDAVYSRAVRTSGPALE